jgi:hypothetical protein
MNTGNRDFDKEAAVWDENPARVKLANDIARAITGQVALTPALKVINRTQPDPTVAEATGVARRGSEEYRLISGSYRRFWGLFLGCNSPATSL